MAEKYYGLSSYNYGGDNPVLIIDLNGTDIWTVDDFGNVRFFGSSEQHLLYVVDSKGYLSDRFISLPNDDLIGSLEFSFGYSSRNLPVYATSSKSAVEIFSIFKFLADNNKVEWIVYKNANYYILGSLHESKTSGTASDYGLSCPESSVHSHPSVDPDYLKELETMGYWPDKDGSIMAAGDWRAVRRGDKRQFNYVYFPESKNLYNVEYQKPRFIRNIGSDYHRFFFGTLNER